MRRRVRVVTDSTALFPDSDFPGKHNVVVTPLTIHVGNQSFLDGVEIGASELFARVAGGSPLPTVSSPDLAYMIRVYEQLGKTADEIVSIHVSSKLSRTWHNARIASSRLLSLTTVVPIDSHSTSVGLGLLVMAAAEAAEAGKSVDEIVRILRGMIPRLYSVFFTESLEYLENAGRIGKAQAVLGTMLGIRPFLILEDGDIRPMEKVRTRQQAVEKLWEFICEFSSLEYVAILQHNGQPGSETHVLTDRLALEFPDCKFDVIPYSPSLAAFVGPSSMGVAVFEGESDLSY